MVLCVRISQVLCWLEEFYGVKLYLFYGKELFDYLKKSEMWDNIIDWLRQWKDGLPELPEIDLDATPKESFEETKDLELRNWRKILENDKLWEERIIHALFRQGTTLEILLNFFEDQPTPPYKKLANLLKERLRKYYGIDY